VQLEHPGGAGQHADISRRRAIRGMAKFAHHKCESALARGANQGLTLSDATGTPLETLGITPGLQAPELVATRAITGTITGAGGVVINQGASDNLVVDGTAAWHGATDLLAGTLTFVSDVSGLTGPIEDSGPVVFAGTTSVTGRPAPCADSTAGVGAGLKHSKHTPARSA
jgi:hypothetical protein